MRLRAAEEAASELVGADTVRAFRRYLASSEVQFRTGALTNYRFVLRRRDIPHDTPHEPPSGSDLVETVDGEIRDH